MTRFALRNLLLSVVLSFAYSGLFAQTYCDDLTTLSPYSILQSSDLVITDTVYVGDTISAQGANTVITAGGIYLESGLSPHLYIANTGLHQEGITGDGGFILTPVLSSYESLKISLYLTTEYTNFPGFSINNDTSGVTSYNAISWHSLDDFPMTVGGINVSIDTTLENIVIDTTFVYPDTTYSAQIIKYGAIMKFEGQIDELLLGFNSDIGSINELCYENAVLNLEEPGCTTTILYPNPTSEYFQIQSGKTFTSVHMYNILGKEVLSQSLDEIDYKVDCSRLTSGIYLVALKDNMGKISTQKLVVE